MFRFLKETIKSEIKMQSDENSRLCKGISSKSPELIPTGISSLDSILNGGFPIGAVVLIEEDELRTYSELFVNYFLAEGVASKDHVFLASVDNNPLNIMKELPPPVEKKEEVEERPVEKLKIAWRYQDSSPVPSSPSTKHSLSHDFNFNSKLGEDVYKHSSLTVWPDDMSNSGFNALFSKICGDISSKGLWHGNAPKSAEKKILRICVQSLGSPFWSDEKVPIYQILLKLRTAVHNSSSIALVTIPTGLIDRKVVLRCEQISDIVLSVNSLANNTNKQFSEYSGLLKVSKVNTINALSVHVPEDSDWAFKVKKKKLIIEKLHLPPEAGITDQREQDDFAKISRPNCNIQF